MDIRFEKRSKRSRSLHEKMERKIREWDSSEATDVSGARLAYTFIPTGFGLVIEVCDAMFVRGN
jgi:hypothetical protein